MLPALTTQHNECICLKKVIEQRAPQPSAAGSAALVQTAFC